MESRHLIIFWPENDHPRVVFGPAAGTTAGEFFRIKYTTNRPLVSARLVLLDGRELVLTIGVDEFAVTLPADTPRGFAGIRVTDDDGHTRFYPTVVELFTTAPVRPPRPPAFPLRRPSNPARPAPVERPAPRVVTIGTRVRVRTSTRVTVVQLAPLALRPVTATAVRHTRTLGSEIAALSRAGIRPLYRSEVVYAETASTTRVGRRDGPAIEEMLLVLGVL